MLLLIWRCQNIWCITVCFKWGCIASEQAGFPHANPSPTLQQWGSRASYQNYWIIDEGGLSWWIIYVIMYGKEATQQQNVEQCSAWNLVSVHVVVYLIHVTSRHIASYHVHLLENLYSPYGCGLFSLVQDLFKKKNQKKNLQDLKKLMLML